MWPLTRRLKVAGIMMLANLSISGQPAALANTGSNEHRSIGVVGISNQSIPEVAARPGYALLLGASRYRSPRWPNLSAVPDELTLVGNALRHQGFVVRTEVDQPSVELFRVMREFIANRGADPRNRLIVYFAGHGYSRNEGQRGYIVPVDAPHPSDDLRGFLSLALDMTQVMAWARQIESDHALFIFDSCFSGTVLQQRGEAPPPLLIRRLSAAPVRQFITAGSAGELVPAKSDFAPALAAALTQGLADLDGDGFITGTELGMYLQSHISQYGRQTPWFGKISDPAFAGGEFIFRGTESAAHIAPASRPTGALTIESNPPGAQVFLDGKLAGLTPVTIHGLPAKPTRIELRADGRQSHRMEVEIVGNTIRTVSMELPAEPKVKRFWVDTNPSQANIEFIGDHRRYSPGMELSAGEYKVRVTAAGHQSREVPVQVQDSDVRLVVALQQAPQPSRTHHDRSVRISGPTGIEGSPPVPATCWVRNSLGQVFYWTGVSRAAAHAQAVWLCQYNTPYGAFCQPTACY